MSPPRVFCFAGTFLSDTTKTGLSPFLVTAIFLSELRPLNSVTISDDKNFELEYLIFSKVLWEIPDSIIG